MAWTPKQSAILEPEQLAALLEHAGNYRLLFEFLAHTGLRIGEALGLTWADIDHQAGLIRVHRQLSRRRDGTEVPLRDLGPVEEDRRMFGHGEQW